jgi:hypothetical protein
VAVTIIRGNSDPQLAEFVSALDKYAVDHPNAEISLYRHGKYSIRVRIVDPEFAGQSKSRRHMVAWPYLASLPEETLSDLSSLILLTPDEKGTSFANLEFDDPIPSRL